MKPESLLRICDLFEEASFLLDGVMQVLVMVNCNTAVSRNSLSTGLCLKRQIF